MSKTRFEIYNEIFEDNEKVLKKEVADLMGVTPKTLSNYLNEKTTMPTEKEIILIDYLNKKTGTKLNYTILPFVQGNKSATTISLSLEDLKKHNQLLNELKKVEKKYNITLFEEIYDPNFKLLQIAFGKEYFRTFIENLTQQFIIKKSTEFETQEIDKQFIESIQHFSPLDMAHKVNDYYKNKNRYEDKSVVLQNVENEINGIFHTFIEKLYNDYKNLD